MIYNTIWWYNKQQGPYSQCSKGYSIKALLYETMVCENNGSFKYRVGRIFYKLLIISSRERIWSTPHILDTGNKFNYLNFWIYSLYNSYIYEKLISIISILSVSSYFVIISVNRFYIVPVEYHFVIGVLGWILLGAIDISRTLKKTK